MDIGENNDNECNVQLDDATFFQLMTTRWRIESEFRSKYVYNLPEFYSLIDELEKSNNNLSMTTFRRLVKHLNASYRLRFKLEKDLLQWDPFRADIALAFLASESRRLSTMAHYLVTRVNGYTEVPKHFLLQSISYNYNINQQNLFEETYNNEEYENNDSRSL